MGMLDGKVAIVTGIGSGMGRSIALKFAARARSVVLGARREAYLQEVAAEVREVGPEPLVCPVDLGNEESCEQPGRRARSSASAASTSSCRTATTRATGVPAMESTPQVWREAVEVNLIGALVIAQGIVPSMIERGRRPDRVRELRRDVLQPAAARLLLGVEGRVWRASARTLAVELGPSGILREQPHPRRDAGREHQLVHGQQPGPERRGRSRRLVEEKGSAHPARSHADAGGVRRRGVLPRARRSPPRSPARTST